MAAAWRPNTSARWAPTCSSTARPQEQQGLGLGLIIAKRLTELHGGSLTIESEPGKGTVVLAKLPLAGGL